MAASISVCARIMQLVIQLTDIAHVNLVTMVFTVNSNVSPGSHVIPVTAKTGEHVTPMETVCVKMATLADTVLRNVTTNTGATIAQKNVYVTMEGVIRRQECVCVIWALEEKIARWTASLVSMATTVASSVPVKTKVSAITVTLSEQ